MAATIKDKLENWLWFWSLWFFVLFSFFHRCCCCCCCCSCCCCSCCCLWWDLISFFLSIFLYAVFLLFAVSWCLATLPVRSRHRETRNSGIPETMRGKSIPLKSFLFLSDAIDIKLIVCSSRESSDRRRVWFHHRDLSMLTSTVPLSAGKHKTTTMDT